MAHDQMYLTWLYDAYAMEQALVPILESHARDAADYPEVQNRIFGHIEETRRHMELLRGCIERNGGSVNNVRQSAANTPPGGQQTQASGAADAVVKNGLVDYAAEHFEIAAYTALIAAGYQRGDTETVQACERILRDERQMASWLEDNLPVTVRTLLAQEETTHH